LLNRRDPKTAEGPTPDYRRKLSKEKAGLAGSAITPLIKNSGERKEALASSSL